MDPNEVLAAIRVLISNQIDLDCDPAPELAELIHNLDRWLSLGGFLPSAWTTPPSGSRAGERNQFIID